MSNISTSGAGKTALALLFSSAVAVTGVTAIVPAVSAQPAAGEISTVNANGTVYGPATVCPGDVVTLRGTGFAQRDGGFLVFKLNKNGTPWHADQPASVTRRNNNDLEMSGSRIVNGAWSAQVRLPDLASPPAANYTVGNKIQFNVLGGADDLLPNGLTIPLNPVLGAPGSCDEPDEPTTPPVTTTVTTTVPTTVTTTVNNTVTSTVPTTVTTTAHDGTPSTTTQTVTKTVTTPVPTTVVSQVPTTITSIVPTTVSTTVDRPTTKTTTVTTSNGDGNNGSGSVDGGTGSLGGAALGGLGGLALGGVLVGALAHAVNVGLIQLPEPFAGLVRQALGQETPSQVPVR